MNYVKIVLSKIICENEIGLFTTTIIHSFNIVLKSNLQFCEYNFIVYFQWLPNLEDCFSLGA